MNNLLLAFPRRVPIRREDDIRLSQVFENGQPLGRRRERMVHLEKDNLESN